MSGLYSIEAKNLTKRFGTRLVFKNIDFSLTVGDSIAVTGPNGSGKTTLLTVIAGLASLSSGTLTLLCDQKKLDNVQRRRRVAYIGPEMTLYENLTAWENMEFFATMQGKGSDSEWLRSILETVHLVDRRNDFYGAYSSGMKQRLKYAVALINDPAFLLLDEPSANLDEAGKKIVFDLIERQKKKGILIIATNEKGEYDFAGQRLQLGS